MRLLSFFLLVVDFASTATIKTVLIKREREKKLSGIVCCVCVPRKTTTTSDVETIYGRVNIRVASSWHSGHVS